MLLTNDEKQAEKRLSLSTIINSSLDLHLDEQSWKHLEMLFELTHKALHSLAVLTFCQQVINRDVTIGTYFLWIDLSANCWAMVDWQLYQIWLGKSFFSCTILTRTIKNPLYYFLKFGHDLLQKL